MNGMINVYKEKGMTSHDVVNKLRRILGTKKIGHGGTLDPEAEGVLVIGVDKGTRLLEYVGEGDKSYEAEIVFGFSSTTEDMHGQLTKEIYDNDDLSDEKLEKLFSRLSGTVIAQKPPMYSSVKVRGKKLYQYARQGLDVERKSRNVDLVQIKLLTGIYEKDGIKRARFSASVSKGTYIRTLCVQIGQWLKVPAIMGDLKRTRVSSFFVKDSYKLNLLTEMIESNDFSFMLPLKAAIENNMPMFQLDDTEYQKIKLGQKIANQYPVIDGSIFAGLYRNELVCILKNDSGQLKIIKNVGE